MDPEKNEKTEATPSISSAGMHSSDYGVVDLKPSEKKTTDITVDNASPESEVDASSSTADELVYPGTSKLVLILSACALSIFLVALDTSIVSTAIPRITAEFHSLDDVAWYGSGFFMTMAAFQSMWGKAYKYFPVKTVFLAGVIVFEIGSLICALAPTSTALIIGRAIAGVGGAGISTGSYLIVAISAPPAKTPALQGVVGASFAVASVVGPLLGGVFTEKLTWRWCFWINLPVGGAAFAVIVFFFTTPAHSQPVKATWKEKVLQMDFPGAILILGAVICFLLGLQWAGVTKAWSSADVIGTIVGAVLLFIAFFALEAYLGERAALNFRLLRTRTIGIQMTYQVAVSGTFFVLLYFLPIYFQAVSGVDAAQSGVRSIPLIGVSSLGVIASGIIISVTFEFQPIMIVGNSILAIGSGLIYTLQADSDSGKWIGYQILVGIGIGLSMQIAVIVCQSIVDPADLPAVSAMALFFQLLGGAVWLCVAQSVFQNELVQSLTDHLGSERASQIVAAGATGLRDLLSPEELPIVVDSYMLGITDAFAIPIALACAATVISVAGMVFDRKKLGKGVSAMGAA